MAVYVDACRIPFGRMLMCHMFSPDLAELHELAARIGIRRRLFQDPTTMRRVSWPHYDVCQSKRALAVTCGAIEVDKYQMVAMAAVIRGTYPMRFISEQHAPRVRAWLAEQGFPL